jgi:glutaconate CoA-transferase subunit B
MHSIGPTEPGAEFTPEELLFIQASRFISDTDVVLVGSGLAFVVAMLAQRTHAPGVSLLVDSGAIDPIFENVPQSVSEAKASFRSLRQASMREILGPLLHRGRVVALLGAAEVDRFGNINSSYIRNGRGAVSRLVGSGGAAAMLACAARTVVPLRHQMRRFPERCSYVSSPGYLPDYSGRRAVGLHERQPELTVVTDLCVMTTAAEGGELVVTALMPGQTFENVVANTGFRPRAPPDISRVQPPSEHELRVLRDEVDPHRVYLKSGNALGVNNELQQRRIREK